MLYLHVQRKCNESGQGRNGMRGSEFGQKPEWRAPGMSADVLIRCTNDPRTRVHIIAVITRLFVPRVIGGGGGGSARAAHCLGTRIWELRPTAPAAASTDVLPGQTRRERRELAPSVNLSDWLQPQNVITTIELINGISRASCRYCEQWVDLCLHMFRICDVFSSFIGRYTGELWARIAVPERPAFCAYILCLCFVPISLVQWKPGLDPVRWSFPCACRSLPCASV